MDDADGGMVGANDNVTQSYTLVHHFSSPEPVAAVAAVPAIPLSTAALSQLLR
jgi:hypothetical protein